MVEILARSASKPSCTNAFVKAMTTFEKSTAALEKAVNAMKSLAGTGSGKVHLLLPSTAILMIHDLTNFNIVLWCSRYCVGKSMVCRSGLALKMILIYTDKHVHRGVLLESVTIIGDKSPWVQKLVTICQYQ